MCMNVNERVILHNSQNILKATHKEMAMKMNWRKLGYGTGALAAALTTAYTFNSGGDGDPDKLPIVGCSTPINKNSSTHGIFKTFADASTMTSEIGQPQDQQLKEAIAKSRKLCNRVKNENGLPGLVVGVSVNGKMVWQEGFGYSNVENNAPMKAETVLRIASISKCITMAMLGKLMEDGKIDIDKPIQTYLPQYPEKTVEGEKVVITTRHLLSHLSGIRHYDKKETEKSNDSEKTKQEKIEKSTTKKPRKDVETLPDEFLIKSSFSSVEEAMKLFKDDELHHKPGTKYLYTTHGWTVVSAIIEKLTETKFDIHCKRMFDYWGLENTYLDQHEPIIYNRTSYYSRSKKDSKLINSPYVDNSYKWAGGGFLSTVGDLNKFANMLLYSMQSSGDSLHCENGLPKRPYLKTSTMTKMWTGNVVTFNPNTPDNLYGLGFDVGEPLRKCMFCKERELMTVRHTGGAMGASSVLLLSFPRNNPEQCTPSNTICNRNDKKVESNEVKGVVVAMITNQTNVGLSKTASDIANNFRILI